MASQKSETQTHPRNPFLDEQIWNDLGFTAWHDKLREMSAGPSRTVRQMTEQALGFGRQICDHVGAQMRALNQLAKDGIDYNSRLVEAWTKIGFDAAQSALDNPMLRKN
ncbi:MAG: hypothetical protein JXR83_14760 [Deltaproteobacteria bacterium]|nr:hypothetical protein [Deltaproteobacteria bacterium]